MMGRAARHGQGRLLSMLGRMDGASQKDLAEALGLRPASVSELIDKLEQAELVSRRPNEGDKRSFNVFLTEQGRASAAEAEAGRREFAAELLCDFTEEEREILSNLLGRMIGRLEALAGQEGAGGPQVEEEGERGRPGGRRRGRPDDNDRQCSGPCGRGWRSM